MPKRKKEIRWSFTHGKITPSEKLAEALAVERRKLSEKARLAGDADARIAQEVEGKIGRQPRLGTNAYHEWTEKAGRELQGEQLKWLARRGFKVVHEEMSPRPQVITPREWLAVEGGERALQPAAGLLVEGQKNDKPPASAASPLVGAQKELEREARMLAMVREKLGKIPARTHPDFKAFVERARKELPPELRGWLLKRLSSQ